VKLPSGKFQRHEVHPNLHDFVPSMSVQRIYELKPHDLAASGKKLILLDADNTLLPWKSEEFPQETLDWIAEAKSAGLQLCLISNTRNKERLERLSNVLGIAVAEGKFKPSREMYINALERFQVKPEETVMVGDQLFTDILGANRSGVESILVRPMHHREFIGTRFNRIPERLLLGRLVRAIEGPDDLEIVSKEGIFQKRIVRQLAKFCIVGGTAFILDYQVRMTVAFAISVRGMSLSDRGGNWLINHVPQIFSGMTAQQAFFPVAAACGGAVGILWSFYWNRRWTWGLKGSPETAKQMARFLVISLIGLGLNTLISGGVNLALGSSMGEKNAARVATVVAAGSVAFWSFFGQRLYAFRTKQPPTEVND
jgi:uncharacterized protein